MEFGVYVTGICRYGTPLEIVSDNGKEFRNKLATELYKRLNIEHTTTAAYHPQCNAQAEVCNKTIAKYLNSFVDETTLDWEQYLANFRIYLMLEIPVNARVQCF